MRDLIPKKIWTYWEQGWHQAPDVPQYSFRSWKEMNPSWEVFALDQKNFRNIFGGKLPEIFKRDDIPYRTRSDLLRLELLFRFGGVWADATTICAWPLDQWINKYASGKGFFCFSNPTSSRIMGNWFMASQPNNYIVSKFREGQLLYWKERQKEGQYFWPHEVFKKLYYTDLKFRNLYDRPPHINVSHFFLLREDDPRLNKKPHPVYLDALNPPTVPVFKLTHKFRDTILKNSLFDVLKTYRPGSIPKNFSVVEHPTEKSTSKEVILHIGMAKAASTTIQSWAFENIFELASRGVAFPVNPTLPHSKSNFNNHQLLLHDFLNEKFKWLKSILSIQNYKKIFISLEGISLWYTEISTHSFAKFREITKDQTIKIFINDRNLKKWSESMYRQFLLNLGGKDSVNGMVIPQSATYEQFMRSERMSFLMNRNNFYDRIKFDLSPSTIVKADLEGDWAEQLCQLLGIEDLAHNLRHFKNHQVGFSAEFSEFIRQVNKMDLDDNMRFLALNFFRDYQGNNVDLDRNFDLKKSFSIKFLAQLISKLSVSCEAENNLKKNLSSHLQKINPK